MYWSPALPMEMALEGGESGELDARGGGRGGWMDWHFAIKPILKLSTYQNFTSKQENSEESFCKQRQAFFLHQRISVILLQI